MAKIVVTEEMNPIGPSLLKQAGHQVIEGYELSREEMLKEMEDADALMVRIMPIPKEASDKRNYAVGDSIRFRMAGGLLIGIEQEKNKSKRIAYGLLPVIVSVFLLLMLLEELHRLQQM